MRYAVTVKERTKAVVWIEAPDEAVANEAAEQIYYRSRDCDDVEADGGWIDVESCQLTCRAEPTDEEPDWVADADGHRPIPDQEDEG